MSVWDIPFVNWEGFTASGDQVGNALVAVRRRFVRSWGEAHLRVSARSLDRLKDRVVAAENPTAIGVGFDQSSWDEWLKDIRELVETTFRDVFEIASKSNRKLYLPPPEFAVACSIFFIKSSLVESEGHPLGDFFSKFFDGNIEHGSGGSSASQREQFKHYVTAVVSDLHNESVINPARLAWNPPATESGTKVEESSKDVPTRSTKELPKLEDLCTLTRRDSRSQAMIRCIYKALVKDIGRARGIKPSGNMLRGDLKKIFPALCREQPESYPILSQATTDEIDAYIFGSKSHIQKSEAAVEIIAARCKGVLKIGTIRRYTRRLHQEQTPHR